MNRIVVVLVVLGTIAGMARFLVGLSSAAERVMREADRG